MVLKGQQVKENNGRTWVKEKFACIIYNINNAWVDILRGILHIF